MNTAAKLGTYGAGLAIVFGVALSAGRIIGSPSDDKGGHHTGASRQPDHSGHGSGSTNEAASAHGGHEESGGAAETAAAGLAVSERGYTLVPKTTGLQAGDKADFQFQVVGPDGKPVTHYTPTHEKDLHLIVARRDLSGFQHVHPTLDKAGTWHVPLTFETAGDHRIFADFAAAGDAAGALTLGADVAVEGEYRSVALPKPTSTYQVDDYTVTLTGGMKAGAASELRLSVSRNGKPVTDLEPYLAAYGHLVALRQGDLAYLHVHPQGEPGDGRTAPGPDISFHAVAPTGGTYRLYLDFKHGGTVRTAEFTVVVDPAVSSGQTGKPDATSTPSGEHQH